MEALVVLLTDKHIDELANIFVTKEVMRDSERETIYVFNDNISDTFPGSPIMNKFWDLEMSVDDYHYKWLSYCLSEYADKLRQFVGIDVEDLDYDSINDDILNDLEPDVYNADLLKWIASNLIRSYYVDDALMENDFKSLWSLLQWAQLEEMREVYEIGFEFVKWYLCEYKEESE